MRKLVRQLLSTDIIHDRVDRVLLFYRLAVSFAMIRVHGYKKIVQFEEEILHIPDPFGFGGYAAVVVAILSNIVCSSLVAVGLFTRVAALGALSVPLVGLLFVHFNDPWAEKDSPLVYSIAFIVIMILGPGKYSLDQKMLRALDLKG